MKNKKNVLIISDDENSDTVKIILRLKLIPIIRRSILAAMEILRHGEIGAIIIDKENQNVDTIEFILNARDVVRDIPILVPEQYYDIEDWSLIKICGKIIVYNESNYTLDKELLKILKAPNKLTKDN
jgi:DNA-binding NtrC family response regulator